MQGEASGEGGGGAEVTILAVGNFQEDNSGHAGHSTRAQNSGSGGQRAGPQPIQQPG